MATQETNNDAMIATSVADFMALHDPEVDHAAEHIRARLNAISPPKKPQQAPMEEEGAESSSDDETESDSDDASSDDNVYQGKSAHKRKDGRLRKYGGKNEKDLIKKYNRKHGEKKMKGKSNNAKHGSSYLRLTTADEDQKAQTPDSILGEITHRYGTTLNWDGPLFDPCPAVVQNDKRVDPKLNGISEDFEWGRVNYVNPPYGKIKLWFPKAIQEQKKGKTSIFLIPFRPFTRYFVECLPHISWLEVIYYGVGFRGYAAKIPHPMCMVCFLGKGVKDVKGLHMTQPTNKKHFGWSGDLSVKVPERKHTYVQMVPRPFAFDNATQICRDYGMSDKQIDIMINSSNMTAMGYLDDDKIEKARKSWKHAFALLVPFYNYSLAFQKAMRETTILAYSSPILCNYEGEGKCRFCSVLFVFCPSGEDKKFKKFVSDEKLHPFRMAFNYNGYLPSEEDLKLAKMEKIQKQKGMTVHKAGAKTIRGNIKDKRKDKKIAKKIKKKSKKLRAKTSAKKAKKIKKPSKSAKKPARTRPISPSKKTSAKKPKTKAQINAARKFVTEFRENKGKLPSINSIRAGQYGMGRDLGQQILDEVAAAFKGKNKGKKRKATGMRGPAAKRAKISG